MGRLPYHVLAYFMKQTIYRIIYHPSINWVLRNLNKLVSRHVKLPPSGTLRLKADNKVFRLRTNQTNYLTKKVFWEGLENFEYTPIFIDLVKKAGTFYDIGANIGFYSVLASVINPKIQVTSFEPASGPLSYLRQNVALGNHKNIRVAPVALSNIEGSIDFFEIRNHKYTYLQHNLGGEGNTGSKTIERFFVKTSVPCTTLDAFVRESGLQRLDLVKMDTEGTEHLILQKATETLTRMKPLIVCETLFNKIEGELEDLLKPLGYEFYNHTPQGLQKVDTLRRAEDNGVRNCFFVHPSKRDWIASFVYQ